MTINLLNRFNHAQHQLALATLPKCGIVEDLLPPVSIPFDQLTGPVWRERQRLALEAVKGGH